MPTHTAFMDTRTLRLAATYLSIIMVMSIGFSLVFYRVSLDHLTVEIKHGEPATTDRTAAPSPVRIDRKIVDVPDDSMALKDAAIEQLNTALQHKIATGRNELRQELVLLNLAACSAGALLSYHLARRALSPIEAALEAQSRFSSDASHELRTPLAVMQTEIDVALRSPHLTLERAKAALAHNRQAIIQLKDLSEGLLRLTHHTRPLTDMAAVSLRTITHEALARTSKLAEAKHITIGSDIADLSLHADAASLTQLLVILLDNAIKYSPPQSAIRLITETDRHAAYIHVEDTGPGIAATDIPHIFERFYRADVSRSHEISGYGLGLAIAQAIATQHRGSLSVRSTVGHGSTFTVKLPY